MKIKFIKKILQDDWEKEVPAGIPSDIANKEFFETEMKKKGRRILVQFYFIANRAGKEELMECSFVPRIENLKDENYRKIMIEKLEEAIKKNEY